MKLSFLLTLLIFLGTQNSYAAVRGCVAGYGNLMTGQLYFGDNPSSEHRALLIARRNCRSSASEPNNCSELGWACNQHMTVDKLGLQSNKSGRVFWLFYVGFNKNTVASDSEAGYKCATSRDRWLRKDRYSLHQDCYFD